MVMMTVSSALSAKSTQHEGVVVLFAYRLKIMKNTVAP